MTVLRYVLSLPQEPQFSPGFPRMPIDRECTLFQVIKDCSLEVTALELRMYGGSISTEFDEKVTHVVVDKR